MRSQIPIFALLVGGLAALAPESADAQVAVQVHVYWESDGGRWQPGGVEYLPLGGGTGAHGAFECRPVTFLLRDTAGCGFLERPRVINPAPNLAPSSGMGPARCDGDGGAQRICIFKLQGSA